MATHHERLEKALDAEYAEAYKRMPESVEEGEFIEAVLEISKGLWEEIPWTEDEPE